MCNDITLGYYRLQVLLWLYGVVYLASVLFNSQSWSNITITQQNKLQTAQLRYLKLTMQAPSSTPNAFVFLELGILPIKYEMDRRKLVFYHHINTLPPTDPVLRVHIQQRRLPFEQNWTTETVSLLNLYGLSDVNVEEVGREKWKDLVTESITDKALQDLTNECKDKTKIYTLNYETFALQKYIISLPFELASLVFKIRSKGLKCLNNHHSSHKDLICRLCNVCIETQEHIINCRCVRTPQDEIISLHQYYQPELDIDNIDIIELTSIKERYKRFLSLINNASQEDESHLVHN